jgi:hypothetical protein
MASLQIRKSVKDLLETANALEESDSDSDYLPDEESDESESDLR